MVLVATVLVRWFTMPGMVNRVLRLRRFMASLERQILFQIVLLVFVLFGLHFDMFVFVVEIVIIIFWREPVVQGQSVLSFRSSLLCTEMLREAK